METPTAEIIDRKDFLRAKVARAVRHYLISGEYQALVKLKRANPEIDYPKAFGRGLVAHIDADALAELANAPEGQ